MRHSPQSHISELKRANMYQVTVHDAIAHPRKQQLAVSVEDPLQMFERRLSRWVKPAWHPLAGIATWDHVTGIPRACIGVIHFSLLIAPSALSLSLSVSWSLTLSLPFSHARSSSSSGLLTHPLIHTLSHSLPKWRTHSLSHSLAQSRQTVHSPHTGTCTRKLTLT